jgi:hypothetical protein
MAGTSSTLTGRCRTVGRGHPAYGLDSSSSRSTRTASITQAVTERHAWAQPPQFSYSSGRRVHVLDRVPSMLDRPEHVHGVPDPQICLQVGGQFVPQEGGDWAGSAGQPAHVKLYRAKAD